MSDDERTSDEVTKAYSAPALEKGLDIIETLSKSDRPLNLIEIADRLNRTKGQIFRMVCTLEQRGYLRHADDGYELTNRLFDIGLRAPPFAGLIASATRAMEKFSDDVRQSSHLAVLSGSVHVVIARCEGPEPVRLTIRLGYSRRFDLSTSGRLLFHYLPKEGQAALLASVKGEDPPVDTVRLERSGRFLRKHGYLVEESDFVVGITDISAPVRSRYGDVLAALSSPVTSYRSRSINFDQIGRRLIEASDDITAHLAN